MNIAKLFRRAPEPVNPASALARMGHRQRRQHVRDAVDQMNRNAGRPAITWPEAR